jgi:hypothetical protein
MVLQREFCYVGFGIDEMLGFGVHSRVGKAWVLREGLGCFLQSLRTENFGSCIWD